MMKRSWIAMALVIALGGMAEAKPGFSTGVEFLEMCESEDDGLKLGCIGYVGGFSIGLKSEADSSNFRNLDTFLKTGEKTQKEMNDETFRVGMIVKKSLSGPWCSPKGIRAQRKEVGMKQLTMVVVKYLKDNPGKIHIHPSFLIKDALVEAFPCPAKRKAEYVESNSSE